MSVAQCGSYSNVNITNLGSGGSSLAFAGLHIVGAYSGTVSLAVPLTVGTYEQTTGTLRQGNATYDLTVNDAFLWTGGILNDIDSGACVDIASAVGRMDPPDSTSLSIATASTLNILSGSVVTLLPGILEFLGGEGMTIAGEVKGITNISKAQSLFSEFVCSVLLTLNIGF